MATQVQQRGGTTVEHSTFTGAVREVTVDTTKDTVVVHDGVTAGGFPLARESALTTKVAKTADTGSAVLPSGTTLQRDAAPAAGYLRWNADETSAEVFDGTEWAAVGGGNTTDQGLYEHANTISENYVMTAGNNALTAGPITINTGVSVSIPTGSTWVIA